MAVRQYIGARYVPILMGEWDKALSYEALNIVTYKNNSFTSKKPVPQGIEITNTDYWVNTGNFNAQVAEFANNLNELTITVNELSDSVNTLTENVSGLTENVSGLTENVSGLTTDINNLKRDLKSRTLIGSHDVAIAYESAVNINLLGDMTSFRDIIFTLKIAGVMIPTSVNANLLASFITNNNDVRLSIVVNNNKYGTLAISGNESSLTKLNVKNLCGEPISTLRIHGA